MGTINWTDEAQRWLQDIFDYIASDSPRVAMLTVQGIFDRVQVLSQFHEIGHRHTVPQKHVRVLLYGHYRIAYLVKGDGNIDILGVFHGSLDLDKYQL